MKFEIKKNEDGELVLNDELLMEISKTEIALEEAKKAQKEYKSLLLKNMEKFGITKIENPYFSVTYVAESETVKVNQTKLQEKYEEVYLECLEKNSRASFVRIKSNLKK